MSFMSVQQACATLKAGQPVALPTETVYGLAANATSAAAVAHIYSLKQRPQFNPLISHYARLEDMQRDVILTPTAHKLAAAFWPGPLTLVLNTAPDCRLAALTCAGLPTAAVRVPAHPVMQQVLQLLPFPLAAPSANVSGRLSPTTAQHVQTQFGATLPVLDGGACSVGVESTIIDLSTPQPILLREGGLAREEIEAALGQRVPCAQQTDTVKAPGMLLRHYAPKIPLTTTVPATVPPRCAWVSFGKADVPAGVYVHTNLSPDGDYREAAATLFETLHQLEQENIDLIVAPLLPEQGLGRAINDRLRRAANTQQQ